MVAEHCGVSCEVGKVCMEVGEGEEEVGRVQKERRESQARSRELAAKIEVGLRERSARVRIDISIEVSDLWFIQEQQEEENPAGETSTDEIAKLVEYSTHGLQ